MKNLLRLEPVIDTLFKIVPDRPARKLPEDATKELLQETLAANEAHFGAREMLADLLTAAGDVERACQLRLEGAVMVSELFEEEDLETVLDWEDPFTALALSVVYDSAMDHFVIGDLEMAAAMLELLADRDPEDHLNAAELLAFCYAAFEEWELFDELANALPSDLPATRLLNYWAAFLKSPDQAKIIREDMKRETPALYKEWTADGHDISEEYLRDIESRRPSAGAEARRLWLRTEQLWRLYPAFTTTLRD